MSLFGLSSTPSFPLSSLFLPSSVSLVALLVLTALTFLVISHFISRALKITAGRWFVSFFSVLISLLPLLSPFHRPTSIYPEIPYYPAPSVACKNNLKPDNALSAALCLRQLCELTGRLDQTTRSVHCSCHMTATLLPPGGGGVVLFCCVSAGSRLFCLSECGL